MRSYDDLLDLAVTRKGSLEAVMASVPPVLSPAEVASVPDDRWLMALTRGIFTAGFSSKVIADKWPGFEAAFHGFDPGWCAMIEGERLDDLLSDTRIVRNGAKVRSVQGNAVFLQDIAQEAGSFGAKLAAWPPEEFASMLLWLKAGGARLGGVGVQYSLRAMGYDGFVLSRSVEARLRAEAVIDGPPTSQKALRAIQKAFNTWMAQSGTNLTTVSRVLAQSIDV